MFNKEDIIVNNTIEQLESEISQLETECSLVDFDLCKKSLVLKSSDIIHGLLVSIPTVVSIIYCCFNMGLSRENTINFVNSFVAPVLLCGLSGSIIGLFVSNIYSKINSGYSKEKLRAYIESNEEMYYEKIQELDDKEIEMSNIKKRVLMPSDK